VRNLLSQLRTFDELLRGVAAKDVDLKSLFVPIGDIDEAACLDLYRVNQREGKYKVLQKFFPATEKLVGPERFRQLAVAFIGYYPSETFTLSSYHPKFAGFVGANTKDNTQWVLDVARFEWAWHRLGRKEYRAPAKELREKIALASPTKSKFRLSPTVIIERQENAVFEVYRSILADGEYAVRPWRHWQVFWRPEATVRKRRAVNRDQAHLLKLLRRGMSLDVAVRNIETYSKVNPAALSRFMATLIDDGILIDVV
jgi:hypothetical protein